jgi:hypothetical protein
MDYRKGRKMMSREQWNEIRNQYLDDGGRFMATQDSDEIPRYKASPDKFMACFKPGTDANCKARKSCLEGVA